MFTRLYTADDGTQVEYRRHPFDPVVLHLEHRLLRPDGTPYGDGWHPVTDRHLLALQLASPEGREIVQALADLHG